MDDDSEEDKKPSVKREDVEIVLLNVNNATGAVGLEMLVLNKQKESGCCLLTQMTIIMQDFRSVRKVCEF